MTTPSSPTGSLARREREILEIVYRLGEASVAEVRSQMAPAPSYSSVRTMLNSLERKRHLRHTRDGTRFVYWPTIPKGKARVSALRHVIETFFDGSVELVVAAMVGGTPKRLSRAELQRLRRIIESGGATE